MLDPDKEMVLETLQALVIIQCLTTTRVTESEAHACLVKAIAEVNNYKPGEPVSIEEAFPNAVNCLEAGRLTHIHLYRDNRAVSVATNRCRAIMKRWCNPRKE